MRFDGVLKSWNDERGFGFLEPLQGGEQIFVHIKAFPSAVGRPQLNQAYSFEVELGPKGKRAKNLQVLRPRASRRPSERQERAQWGTATLFAIPAFLAVYGVVAVLWRPTAWIAAFYLGVSVLTFVVYAADKAAAAAQRWRTPESTLHALALVH
jgi:cold shock CspA family protein